jgi:hypothetical protein
MPSGFSRLAAITWPEDTYTYTPQVSIPNPAWVADPEAHPRVLLVEGEPQTWRIRGISISHPDYIAYVFAPYYLEDATTLADAVNMIRGEIPNLDAERAKRVAKLLGLARRPIDIPPRERTSREAAAAIIMGTLDDDGTNAFGWKPGAGIPRDVADRLRSEIPYNDLLRWGDAIYGLSTGAPTKEAVEEGKASSSDEETSETFTT